MDDIRSRSGHSRIHSNLELDPFHPSVTKRSEVSSKCNALFASTSTGTAIAMSPPFFALGQ